MRKVVRLSFLLVLALSGACCGVWRGIPSHGGGKRFDEEQRVVASAIRRTLADMDLTDLQGKRVQIAIDCIAQDGGGNVSFPGLSGISGGASGNEGSSSVVQVIPGSPGGPSWINDNRNSGWGGNVGFHYRAETSYGTHAYSTAPDVTYLKASLEMKARHAGLVLTAADPEVVLYVLVDVLGTNRSHRSSLVSGTETLVASCEATYYAQNPKTGDLVFEARRASSAAVYAETRRLGTAGPEITRTIDRTVPTPLPVDSPVKPSTQPAVAEKKPWLENVWNRLAGAD